METGDMYIKFSASEFTEIAVHTSFFVNLILFFPLSSSIVSVLCKSLTVTVYLDFWQAVLTLEPLQISRLKVFNISEYYVYFNKLNTNLDYE